MLTCPLSGHLSSQESTGEEIECRKSSLNVGNSSEFPVAYMSVRFPMLKLQQIVMSISGEFDFLPTATNMDLGISRAAPQ